MAQAIQAQVVNLRQSEDAIVEKIIKGWLIGYADSTRYNYRFSFMAWARWLRDNHESVLHAESMALELFGQLQIKGGMMPGSVFAKMSAVKSFYRWAAAEGYIPNDQMAHVRMPKFNDNVMRPYLSRLEAAKFLDVADASSPRDAAVCCLLLLNGLRAFELCGLNCQDVYVQRSYYTLNIKGKGGRFDAAPLSARTYYPLSTVIGDRTSGPIFLSRYGNRLDNHCATMIVKRIARKAGVQKRISLHSLRRTFVTLSLDAGVSIRDVQHGARHADPATTARYDQHRVNLDTHPTHTLTSFVSV